MEISLEPRFLMALHDDPEREARQHEVLLDVLGEAEERGFARAWVEPVAARSAPHEALRLCVSAAWRCERMRVVASALDGRFASWIRFAEDVATADALLAGRLELGFAAGAREDRMLARVREAWAGGQLRLETGADDPGNASTFELHPRPTRPDGPPLWASIGDESSARAAAECDLNAIVPDIETAAAYASATRGAPGFQIALDAAGDPSRARAAMEAAVQGLAPLRDSEALGLALRVPIEVATDAAPVVAVLRALPPE